MIIIIQSAFITLSLLLFNRLRKEYYKFSYYLLIFVYIFILNLIANLFLSSKLGAQELNCESRYFIPNSQLEIASIDINFLRALNAEQKKFYQEKIKYHYLEGERYFLEAKDMCWYIPNWSNREKATYCFTNFMALASPGTPPAKAVIFLITLLTQYGLTCIDQWHEIENKLNWAAYHYDLYEWYSNVFQNG